MISWYFRRFRPVRRHTVSFRAPRLETIEDRINMSASFIASPEFPATPPNPNTASWTITAGDFDTDGKQDYISFGGKGNSNIGVYLGNGDGTWTDKGTVSIGTGIRTDTVVVGDFTDQTGLSGPDGLDDFAFINNNNTGSIDVWASQGDGTFFPVIFTTVTTQYVSMAAGDLNSDGAADLVVGRTGGGGPNGTAGEYAVFINNRDGSFTESARTYSNGMNSVVAQPTIADLNHDGFGDLVAVNSKALQGFGTPGTFYGQGAVYFGSVDINGVFSFTGGSALLLPDNTTIPDDAVVGDFDGDGLEDVAIVANTGTFSTFYVYYQLANIDVNGFFPLNPDTTFTTNAVQRDVVAADFDFDGIDDIAFTTIATADLNFHIFNGVGDQTFDPVGGDTFPTTGFNTPIAVIDGDFNGTPDLIVGTYLPGNAANFQYFNNDNLPQDQQLTSLKTSAIPDPSVYGNAITFTAKVKQFGFVPTGEVEFFVDGTSIGFATLDGLGVATLVAPGPFAVGIRNLGANYSGDEHYFELPATPRTFTVDPLASNLSFTFTDQDPFTTNIYGETVTLDASVGVVGSFIPTGTFSFYSGGIGGTFLGSAPVDINGVATLDTALIPVGTNTLTAVYSGDPIYANNTIDAVQTLDVIIQPTALDVITSFNPSVFGQSITFDIAVTNASVGSLVNYSTVYSGQVALLDNSNTIAILDVGPDGTYSYAVPADFALGSHVIQAFFVGTPNLAASSSTPFTQVVNKADVFVDLTFDYGSGAPNPLFGETIHLIAAVDILLPGVGSVQGTNVEFYQDGVLIATVPVDAAVNGEATFDVTNLPVGTYTFFAKFVGNDTANPSISTDVVVQIDPTTSSTAFTVTPSNSSLGTPIVLEATVTTPLNLPVNVGTVTFTGTFNGDPIDPIVVPVVNGFASVTLPGTTFAFGSGQFFANFTGTSSIVDSAAGPVDFTVTQAVPLAVLVADAGISAPLGSTVGFAVTMVPPSGVPIVITGSVQFFDNGTLFDTQPIVNGAASTSRRLSLGVHNITAAYSGDTNYVPVDSNAVIFSIFRPTDRFSVGAGPGGPDLAYVYDATGNLVFSPLFAFSPDHTAGVRVGTGDFDGDGVQDVVLGTGPGTVSRVKILSGKDGSPIADFAPFGDKFVGGVFVAVGDVNGDLLPDLIVTPDVSGGARVRVYDGLVLTPNNSNPVSFADFFAIIDGNGNADTKFRGGARASIGDVDGDGYGDVVVAAGFGGGPRVATFNGKLIASSSHPKLFGDFLAFEGKLRNGAYVAVGDVDGDGKADIVGGAGPGGGPRITIFSGDALLHNQEARVSDFFAGDVNNRGGIPVALRHLDGDERLDLITGTGAGSDLITAYLGTNLIAVNTAPPTYLQFHAFTDNTPDPKDAFRGTYVG
ncbi:hypothetical protein BH11PLA2_BH11PLA2_18740 [soil metagenome]